MTIRVVTQPVDEPVSLAEAKAQCRVELSFSDDDALLMRQIRAARRWAEGYLHRPIITQTRELLLDGFPCGPIVLIDSPITQLVSLVYVDANGGEQAVTDPQADLYSDPARIAPAYGTSWPTARGVLNAVRVRYVAGYGSAAEVHDDIKSAILLVVADLYAHREDSIDGTITRVPNGARDLLDQYQSYAS